MTKTALFTLSTFVAYALLAVCPLQAESGVEKAFPDYVQARGVIVVVGETDPQPIIALAKAAPVVVLVIAENEEAATRLANEFRQGGVYGQVTAASTAKNGRIPLADNTAATVILNGDMPGELSVEELHRVLRPFGRLVVKEKSGWKETTLPRPKGMDDWASYDKDAAASQHSKDTLVGPPRGLQWVAGPTNQQSYTLIKNETALTLHQPDAADHQSESLMARDAFSGLPMWERTDLTPRNRFAVVLGEQRIVLHPSHRRVVAPHTIAVNRLTGKTEVVYDQGIDCTVTDEQLKADRSALQKQAARTEDLQLRLIDGLLIQIVRDEIIVLNEETGKRQWSRKSREGEGFVHPVCGNGRLYIVEGPYQRHSSYTHWPMAKPSRIMALSLESGKEDWTLDWDESKFGKTHAVYNLQLEGDRLGGAVTVYMPDAREPKKPRPQGLILNANNGEVIYWGREELPLPEGRDRYAWPGQIGAGHSHVRLHLRGDTAWTAVLGSPIAYWNVDKPEDFTCFAKLFDPKGEINNLRPVSCTVWRSTPNWWYGGLGCYPVSGEGEGHFNRSGRSNCDIGAFPANGLLYSPPNTCQCQPYLPGTKSYHSRTTSGQLANEERLITGPAKPAPHSNDDDGWPQWQRDATRRAWTHREYPTDLKPLWSWKVASTSPPPMLDSQWKSDGILFGPLTQSTCAEGIVAVADANRHEVIGLDPDSGEVRWRAPVDGRVDMAPSIYQGVVLCGTRNGYVYALNRDSGEVVWRFFAAPQTDRIVVNGQLESPWPVFGAIPVDKNGLIAIAGRHTSNDGGLWWWQLEPATGKLLAHGRFDEQEAKTRAANWPRKLPIEMRPIQNSVAVMTDNWFCLPGNVIRRTNGRLGAAEDTKELTGASFIEPLEFTAIQHEEQIIRMGQNALIGEKKVTVGGWRKPFYANTIARIFAIDEKNKRFVSVGGGIGTASGRGGGGDSTVHLMNMLGTPVSERRGERFVEQAWEYHDRLLDSRGLPSVTSLAVSDNAVFLGMSIYGNDKKWRDARAAMPHRLRIIELKTGEFIRDIAVPDRVLQGGIALAGGRVFVTTEDGSVTAYASK